MDFPLDSNIIGKTLIHRIFDVLLYTSMIKNTDNMKIDLNYFDAQIMRFIVTSERIRKNTA